MGRKKTRKPNFNDASWNTTAWSLWGWLYPGAASDGELQLHIEEQFGRARQALRSLGVQIDPMRSAVEDWRGELNALARTITYGEAGDVLERLTEIANAVERQAATERELVRSRVKPAKIELSEEEEWEEEEEESSSTSDEDLAWVRRYQKTVMGHSAETARSRPREVKSKKWKPPTPQEIWKYQQRQMATQCDNGIGYGSHAVTQHSVLKRLNPADPPGSADQYRPGPENGHERIIRTDEDTFWTVGLSHSAKRDKGEFSVYRRKGHSNTFEFVSGQRLPKDPMG